MAGGKLTLVSRARTRKRRVRPSRPISSIVRRTVNSMTEMKQALFVGSTTMTPASGLATTPAIFPFSAFPSIAQGTDQFERNANRITLMSVRGGIGFTPDAALPALPVTILARLALIQSPETLTAADVLVPSAAGVFTIYSPIDTRVCRVISDTFHQLNQLNSYTVKSRFNKKTMRKLGFTSAADVTPNYSYQVVAMAVTTQSPSTTIFQITAGLTYKYRDL